MSTRTLSVPYEGELASKTIITQSIESHMTRIWRAMGRKPTVRVQTHTRGHDPATGLAVSTVTCADEGWMDAFDDWLEDKTPEDIRLALGMGAGT